MKHVHHDIIQEWIKDISRTIQWSPDGVNWTDVQGDPPLWSPYAKYRFKPEAQKFITVNGVNVPEPVRKELKRGQEYWLALVATGHPTVYSWHPQWHNGYLTLGIIHLTKEAAQIHIDAMLLPSRTDK